MAAFAADTFAGVAASDLGGQSASDGGTWTARDGTGSISGTAGGQVTSASSGSRRGYYHSAVPPSADQLVEADIVTSRNPADRSIVGIAARMNTAAVEQYMAAWSNAPGYYLAVRAGAVDTQIGSISNTLSPANNTTRRLGMSCVGTTISLFVGGGAALITGTNSALSAAGRVGLYNDFTDDTTTGLLDNWQATDATPPPQPNVLPNPAVGSYGAGGRAF